MKLIVGLWNPWKVYEKTRHNIGFIAVDNFIEPWIRDKEQGTRVKGQGKWEYKNTRKWEIIEANIEGQKIVFLKPMEFMNRSWGAVGAIANFYKIEPTDILVIHDDIDLPVWKVQLKLWGSSAGHNGLKDIIAKLGTKEFRRLRIWVDRPVHQDDVADYVLSSFKKEEKNLIDDKAGEIETCINNFILR